MAESFYGGRAGHDFTIYHCYSSLDEMNTDFKQLNSHTPIGGYCLTSDGELYRREINNNALSLGNIAVMGMEDLENTFLYKDGENIILPEITKTDVPTKILTMENGKFASCGISGGTDISVSMAEKKIKINHNAKSFTPTTKTQTLSYGGTFAVPSLGYDAQGHINSKETVTYTLPAAISYSAGTGISLNNNTISLNAATSSALGGIQTGYTSSGKKYAVKLDNNNAYVEVPWENTTYSSKDAVAGGTEVSLVTTGEKAAWNAKGSGNGTVTSVSIKVNGEVKGPITTSGEIDLGTLATTDTTYSAGGGLTLSGNTFSLGGSNKVTLPLTLVGEIETGGWIRLNDSTTKLPKKVSSNTSYCVDWELSDSISLAKDDKIRIYSSDGDGFLDDDWNSATKDNLSPCILLRTGADLHIVKPSSGAAAQGSGWYFTEFETHNGCYTTLILTAPETLSNITSMSLILPTSNQYVNTDLQTRSNAYLGTSVGTKTVTLLKIDKNGKTTFYDYDN